MVKYRSRPIQRTIASIANLIIFGFKLIQSSPLAMSLSEETKKGHKKGEEEVDFSDPWNFWPRILLLFILLCIAAVLAGLTIGLMSLDETNLEILKKSGSPEERKYAAKIEPLRKQGHLVLCTLLLSNVVVNEALPVLMDPVIGGGVKAILGSSALLVIFAEIIPQAIFTKHSLMIGAKLAWLVRSLMFIMYPLAYPIAHTLDRLLGESHKTVYCRAELKELVSMHDHELIPDEVRIIKSVLDLREKSAVVSMTHLKDAFMLDWDDVIDRDTIERILSKGHSRVPVYYRERDNIIGMVLVKKLVAVKKGTPVRKISLSPLLAFPSTTPLFEIMNIFQQGKSHMATVYEKSRGKEMAIGIITLEDVIEELIGGEIVDETDEYFSNEGKIKVIRQLKRNSFIQSSASPRLHILNQNPVAMCKPTSLNPTLTTEFPGHSIIPQIIKTDPSQSPQDGDLVLVTAIPGKSFMGRVIDPYEDYDYTEQHNGANYGSLSHTKGPLLVVPSVNPPCADPSVHLLDYNRHPEPQYHCSLIHPQNNNSTRPKSKYSSKTPKNRRSQTLPLLSTEDNSENEYTTGINTPKTEFETSPQPKISSLPNPAEEFKPIIEDSTKLLNN